MPGYSAMGARPASLQAALAVSARSGQTALGDELIEDLEDGR